MWSEEASLRRGHLCEALKEVHLKTEGTAGAKVLRWELPRMRNCKEAGMVEEEWQGGAKQNSGSELPGGQIS